MRAITYKCLVIVLPIGVCAQGIHITPGANVVLNGNVKLVLNNAGLITNGNFEPGLSTILLTGAGTDQSWLGGSAAASFFKIIINRQADVMLRGSININDTLSMIKGNLQLNNYTINLNGFLSGESNQSSVTGTSGGAIRVTTKLNAPLEVNPGNIGVDISSLSNLGKVVIERRHVQQMLTKGMQGIQRYFQITASNNSQLNATLRFFYLDKELAGTNESSLTLWKGADLGNYWLLNGRDSIDVTANYVVKTGIDHFTRYTLGPETADQLSRVAGPGKPEQLSQSDSLRNLAFFKPVTTMQVYPNPLHEQFRMALFSDSQKEYTINLYDQYGHLLQTKKIWCRSGMNHIPWNVSKYAPGIYYLVFENRAIKLIKK
ncbi:T9SS type A sorting domain-containing protein [Niastella caeni]|uniref:T9SS type A sorting domain-containing protein n=1 Tax=Niastella caeni TaxID=2569763 RepID=UPI00140A95F7|nr:T9SS type A sorting domain-containing protein [Niastella caeni]